MNAYGYKQQMVPSGMHGVRGMRLGFDRKDLALFKALFHLVIVACAVVFLFFVAGCDEGLGSSVDLSGADLETVLPPSSDLALFDLGLDDLFS